MMEEVQCNQLATRHLAGHHRTHRWSRLLGALSLVSFGEWKATIVSTCTHTCLHLITSLMDTVSNSWSRGSQSWLNRALRHV